MNLPTLALATIFVSTMVGPWRFVDAGCAGKLTPYAALFPAQGPVFRLGRGPSFALKLVKVRELRVETKQWSGG